jgi:hypothetical protein
MVAPDAPKNGFIDVVVSSTQRSNADEKYRQNQVVAGHGRPFSFNFLV